MNTRFLMIVPGKQLLLKTHEEFDLKIISIRIIATTGDSLPNYISE